MNTSPKPLAGIIRGEARPKRAAMTMRGRRFEIGSCSVTQACVRPCLKLGAVSLAKEVDHIVPKVQAKRLCWAREQVDARENLQAICKGCHAAKTARESRGLVTSFLV